MCCSMCFFRKFLYDFSFGSKSFVVMFVFFNCFDIVFIVCIFFLNVLFCVDLFGC